MPKAKEKTRIIINPDGTAAEVIYEDDSCCTDSSYWEQTVYLKFLDSALNPPGQAAWEAGSFSEHWKTPVEALDKQAREIGEGFYDFLMGLRTIYSLEDTVNGWRKRYEAEVETGGKKSELILRFQGQIRTLEARVKELETDYVKKLESEIRLYQSVIRMARERALKDAELLDLKTE